MARKVPINAKGVRIAATTTATATATATSVPSVEALSGQVMTWIGLSMRLSKAQPMAESLVMLNELGLTMPQIVALHVMAFEGAMTMTRLVERLGLSTSAVSHLLHRLVQMGLCDRRDDPADRRQKRVRLTPAGVDVVRRLLKSRVSDTRGSIEPLSSEARRRLSEVLTMIVGELTEQVQTRAKEQPSTSAGCLAGEIPHSLDDVLQRLERFGDDIDEPVDKGADQARGSSSGATGKLGDRTADTGSGIGDRVADRVAQMAAVAEQRPVRNVNARVERARRNKQEKP